MIRRTHSGSLIADGDIELALSGRIPGECQIIVKGIVHYVGSSDRASVIFNDLTERKTGNRRHHDNMLRRLLR